jgi:hypothetical protein
LISDRLVQMRPVAIVLCLSLFGLNAEAAMLHVHEGDADSDHHHHGPAIHAHKLLNVIGVEAPAVSHVPQFSVTSRAHGPPAGRSCSLRAPPRSLLL